MGLTENEKKKEYLQGYGKAVRQLKRNELRLQEIRMNRLFPSVINDGMPHAHNNNDLSSYAALLDQAEKKCRKQRYKLMKKCEEITDRIERLSDEDEKDVLMYRYIKLMNFEDICVKMEYSRTWVFELHKNALKHFFL